jgi:uncharacterized membrane protein YdjX (TVP38/TMEM64 family)
MIRMSSERATGLQTLRRYALPAAVAAAVVAAYGLGAADLLSLETLRDHRGDLMAFVNHNAVLAVLAFMVAYAAATAVSLPGGAMLSIAGGFLFGSVLGTLWIVVGATAGAVGVFLAARSVLARPLRAKAGPWLKKLERGFQENAFNYLLTLRLVPLFPFFVVNLVPAFLGMNLRTYTVGTAVGIIPGAFVFASVGAGLDSVFPTDGDISAAGALTTEVVVAMVGLAALSLLPVAYKALKARRQPA